MDFQIETGPTTDELAAELQAFAPKTESVPATKPSLEQQVAEWSAERAEIAELVKSAEGVTIAGHVDGPKAGRDKVHDTLMPIWRKNVALEKREKELLEIPKALTAKIKSTRQELSAPLTEVENREKVAAWAHAALDAMPELPEVTDAAILRQLRNTVEGIRQALVELGRVDG
jgi:hypothetical protein